MSRWRRRAVAVVLGLLVLGWVLGCVLLADRFVAAWQVDTQVTAVVEEGCVATFTDPAGRRQEVDLRGIKGGCGDGDPGDLATVWYSSDDPSVNGPTDNWWAYAVLLLSVPAALGTAAWTGRRRVRPTAPVPAHARPDAVGIIRREKDAHLIHDYATGRLDVLIDEVAAERQVPAAERDTGATDASLDSVRRALADTRHHLGEGSVSAAELRYRESARLVTGGWRDDSALAERLLGYQRNIFG